MEAATAAKNTKFIVKVNRNGADHILQLPLNQEELSGLVKSAESVKAAIRALNLDASHETAA